LLSENSKNRALTIINNWIKELKQKDDIEQGERDDEQKNRMHSLDTNRKKKLQDNFDAQTQSIEESSSVHNCPMVNDLEEESNLLIDEERGKSEQESNSRTK
jgi:hypothetical protein